MERVDVHTGRAGSTNDLAWTDELGEGKSGHVLGRLHGEIIVGSQAGKLVDAGGVGVRRSDQHVRSRVKTVVIVGVLIELQQRIFNFLSSIDNAIGVVVEEYRASDTAQYVGGKYAAVFQRFQTKTTKTRADWLTSAGLRLAKFLPDH